MTQPDDPQPVHDESLNESNKLVAPATTDGEVDATKSPDEQIGGSDS